MEEETKHHSKMGNEANEGSQQQWNIHAMMQEHIYTQSEEGHLTIVEHIYSDAGRHIYTK